MRRVPQLGAQLGEAGSGSSPSGDTIDLPKRTPRNGDRVQIVSSLFAGRRGRYAGTASRKHTRVLLQLLGRERQARLDRDAVEQI